MSASSASPRRVPGAPARAVTGVPSRGPAAASAAPLIVAISALAVSLILAIVVIATASAPVTVGVSLPLAAGSAWLLNLVGYLLTPVVVLACYGWDVLAQRNGLRVNRNYVPRPAWTRALLWLTGAGIVLGAWHVLNLSVPLSEIWGGS